MANHLSFQEIPKTKRMIMIAGWRQWADAGSISSGLPEYLIKITGASKIGEIRSDGFYMFQVPGTHHLLRPVIKLEDGYPESLEQKKNEFFYTGDDEKGLIIFLGDEPHMNVEQYAASFFEAVKMLNIEQIAGMAGVYGPVPYNKARQISCIFSLPPMKDLLEGYAVSFSNYEGGASIGSYLVTRASELNIPYFIFYGFAPAYDFAGDLSLTQGIRVENDYKAWHDIMTRLIHILDLHIDLDELQELSDKLLIAIESRINELEVDLPELGIQDFLTRVDEDFTEQPFISLDDFWEDEIRNLFDFDEDLD